MFRISEDGISIPDELLDQLLAGEVVFLCGAGVSSPQLPGFAKLVEDVFKTLDFDKDVGERLAFEAGRFEEVLGSLVRRHAHPQKVYDAIERILAAPQKPDISRHATLLRLSRDLSNRICLVTTNFDTLFERSIKRQYGDSVAALASVAGQALPAPGAESFAGIIHLHGRLDDPKLKLKRTPWVLTSSEYGDAYMRSGWAARFLFDLARCKTIVLVGYRAGDAPVRYFLNILESDRERFTDLRSVYAFDAVESEDDEADARWSTLAVQAITYRKSIAGLSDHGVLWRDLDRLADLVEKPRQRRREIAAEVLQKPLSEVSDHELNRLAWAIKGRGDLWDIVFQRVEDPAWFDHFTEQGLWLETDPDWVLPVWFSTRWTSKAALRTAVTWCSRNRPDLLRQLDSRIRHLEPPQGLWYRAWDLLVSGNLDRLSLREDNIYLFTQRVQHRSPTELELQRGVKLLTPHLQIRDRFFVPDEEAADHPGRLGDLYWVSLATDPSGLSELTGALFQHGSPLRLAQLAHSAIQATLHVAAQAELVRERYDSAERDVPSIAPDEQNAHHDGPLHLVGLAVRAFEALAAENRESARTVSERWRELPGLLGTRMWLHALRSARIYSPADVTGAIEELSLDDFWETRPELLRLMSDRLGDVIPEAIDRLVARIDSEGPRLFTGPEYVISTETDWRPYARDHAMWTRLKAIDAAGALTPDGRSLKRRVEERSPHLDRDLEEQDLFSSYSGGVRSIVGDPEALLETEQPEERLNLAHEYLHSPDIDANSNWSSYCRADPEGALEALLTNGFRPSDAPLWRDLINAVSYPFPQPEQSDPTKRVALAGRLLSALQRSTDDDLQPLEHSLADLLKLAAALPYRTWSYWWLRTWRLAVAEEAVTERPERSGGFYDRVINTSAGKLAELLLHDIERQKKKTDTVSGSSRARLLRVMREPSYAGHLARGAFAAAAGFLTYVDGDLVRRRFLPWLLAATPEGRELREVVAAWANTGPAASRVLKPVLLEAAMALRTEDSHSQRIVGNIIRPIVAPRISGASEDWGFQAGEVRRVLQNGSDALRIAAAQVLSRWQVADTKFSAEEIWTSVIRPTFEGVWPQERRHRHPKISSHLAQLCARSGACFPEAFSVVRPYMIPVTSDYGGLFFLYDSHIPTDFPDTTLEMLWLLIGRSRSSYNSPELGGALDQIRKAKPILEIDRRFQILESMCQCLA